MQVRPATGLILLYMRACRFDGWASFWRVVYVLPGFDTHASLLRHELCHLAQIERDGRCLYLVKYSWWLLRYGYRQNPYEIEARAAE